MEQDLKTFEGGMFPQFGAIDLPKGTYLDALNMHREEDGSITKELGTVELANVQYGSVIGMYVFNDLLYLALTSYGIPRIATLDKNDVLTIVTTGGELVGVFDGTARVRMEAKVNYKGDTVLYLAGEGVALTKYNITLGEVAPLFAEYNLPKITSITEGLGGNVTTGVYQFFVRYVTESLNTTDFSSPTGWYPVIDGDITNLQSKDLDGDPPQTLANKELKLLLEGIDQDFSYIEVGVATYVGVDNVLTGYSLGKARITGTSQLVSFRGYLDYEDTLLLSEFNISSVSYDSAEVIAQKDSTLILGNLTKESNKFDWQTEVANLIVVKSHVEVTTQERTIEVRKDSVTGGKFLDDPDRTINATGGDMRKVWVDASNEDPIGGYKDPDICLNKKSYLNGETYSLFVVPVFDDGTEGDAFHIPATPVDQAGNFVSAVDQLSKSKTLDHVYGSEYGVLAGEPIAYHRFPTSDVIANYDETYSIGIPLQGMEVNLSNLDPSWKDHASNLKIFRESRDGYETVLGTCMANPLVKNVSENSTMLPLGVGGIAVNNSGITGGSDDSAYPTGINSLSSFEQDGTRFDHERLAVFCPDYLTGTLDPGLITKITRQARVQMKVEYCTTTQEVTRAPLRALIRPQGIVSSSGDVSAVLDYMAIAAKGTIGEQRTDSDDVKDLESDTDVFGVKLTTVGNSKCFIIKVGAGVELVHASSQAQFRQTVIPNTNSGTNIIQYQETEVGFLEPIWYICELGRTSDNYYGKPENKEVLFVGELDGDITVLFGGDTFISEYAMTVPYYSPIVSDDISTNVYSEPFGCITVMLPVRSYNNYNFRHQLSEEAVKSVPYYPKTRLLETNNFDNSQWLGETGINNFPAGYGQSVLYNTQYSANQILKPAFTHNFNIEEVTAFINRAIYSSIQSEDDVFDAFSLFLADNYHDIPKDSGEITALNTVGNDLYISTTRKLWRAFYNALVTQSTTEGEVLLGNGGAFSRPSVPIVDVNGGYIGSPSQEATIVSPSGMYVYDTNRHKMFYIGTNGLQEITNPAMFNFIKEANPTDPRLGYDYANKRVLLSSPEVTLSYQPELNSFTSRHSYAFSYLRSLGVQTIMAKSETSLIHKFYDAASQTYFGVGYKATFKTSSIVHPSISKRFVGVEAVVTAGELSGNKRNLPLVFFDFMTCYSYERNTGKSILSVVDGYNNQLESLGTVFAHKANNKFRLSIPSDVVYDINNNIFDDANLVTDPTYPDSARKYRPDMVDNHLVVEFEVDSDKTDSSMSLSSLIINFVKNNT